MTICLEKNFEHGKVSELYKINMEHFTKVLQAKFEKGLIKYPHNLNEKISTKTAEVGDFVKVFKRVHGNGGRYYYGYLQKDNEGRLYVISGKKFGNDKTYWSYVQDKVYLFHAGVHVSEILWKGCNEIKK